MPVRIGSKHLKILLKIANDNARGESNSSIMHPNGRLNDIIISIKVLMTLIIKVFH